MIKNEKQLDKIYIFYIYNINNGVCNIQTEQRRRKKPVQENVNEQEIEDEEIKRVKFRNSRIWYNKSNTKQQ